MDAVPTKLALKDTTALVIDWSNGERRRYTFQHLRDSCPCATCREKRSQPPTPTPTSLLPVLSAAEARPLSVLEMKPVGHYAYSIKFSDGHDTGIYTLELLRRLGEVITNSG